MGWLDSVVKSRLKKLENAAGTGSSSIKFVPINNYIGEMSPRVTRFELEYFNIADANSPLHGIDGFIFSYKGTPPNGSEVLNEFSLDDNGVTYEEANKNIQYYRYKSIITLQGFSENIANTTQFFNPPVNVVFQFNGWPNVKIVMSGDGYNPSNWEGFVGIAVSPAYGMLL